MHAVLKLRPHAFVPLSGKLRAFSLDFHGHIPGLVPALRHALSSSLVNVHLSVSGARLPG
jgi:hypothetical protein